MSTFTLAISFDHFQFALIHGPNIPGSYAILLFTASDFHHQSHLQPGVFVFLFSFVSVSSFFLELFLHWSPVAYWAPTNLGVHLSVSYLFAFSYCSWGSRGNNIKVLCHSLVQWATFCQNSPPWPVHLGWPYTAWLIVSLSWTRLWSMWSVWLLFCDSGFQSVCPLMEKDKRLMGETDWGGNWVLFWWVGPCSVQFALIQFAVDGQGCVPFLLLDLRPNYDGGTEDNGDLLQKVPCKHSCSQCPRISSRGWIGSGLLQGWAH